MSRRRSSTEQLALDYKRTFSSPEGQRVLADLMVWCNVYHPIDETDPIKLAQANGERNVALRIVGYMGMTPETFAKDAERVVRTAEQMLRLDYGSSN